MSSSHEKNENPKNTIKNISYHKVKKGSQQKIQCVSLSHETVTHKGYKCSLVSNAKFVPLKRFRKNNSGGYYKIHNGWCRTYSKNSSSQYKEETYGDPKKILKKSQCIVLDSRTPYWIKKKIRKFRTFRKFGHDFFKVSNPKKYIIIEPKGVGMCIQIRRKTIRDNKIKNYIYFDEKNNPHISNKEVEDALKHSVCVMGETRDIKDYLRKNGYNESREYMTHYGKTESYKIWKNKEVEEIAKKAREIYESPSLTRSEINRKITKISMEYATKMKMNKEQAKKFVKYVKDCAKSFFYV